VRYASASEPNSLYVSNDARDVQLLHPDNERIQGFAEEDRAVVSEPLEPLPGLWREVPASTAIVVQPGADEEVAFRPRRS
jgi:glutamine amidotransferase